jgi:hypothetical protein
MSRRQERSKSRPRQSAEGVVGHNKALADYTAHVDSGGKFSCDHFCIRTEGNLVLRPPHEQILLACALYPLVCSPDYLCWKLGLAEVAIFGLGTMVAILSQVWMLSCIYNELAFVTCFSNSPLLCLACHSSLAAFVSSELCDLWCFRAWIDRLPHYRPEDGRLLQRMQCGFVMQKKTFVLNDVEFELTTIAHGGVSPWYRWVLHGVCAVQALLSIAVLFVGSIYICSATDVENLVEHTMALVFVLEVRHKNPPTPCSCDALST